MSANSLLETLHEEFTSAMIQQVSVSLGADLATTEDAITAALAAILCALAANASCPDGAAKLDRALDEHGNEILFNLGDVVCGCTSAGSGEKILNHIFGNKRDGIEECIARGNGLDREQSSQLFVMLAPIVMRAIGRVRRTNHIQACQLRNMLYFET
jgi:hypothetical protein